uniref:Golgi associated, gamma adaptin ear containing, ARF binding protein 3a n=1 Tax=Callorhinchus milii TaxID=7868 RepID=A0A4W3GDP9_CALMI
QEDWEYIIGFCDQVNKELEGPQIAVRLLAHKIQSPQEWEAVQALTVLEACMKNCGRRFHNEVGKFRFLNELIKVVSPKYLGDRVSEKVKMKVIELLYSWTVALPEETKIKDAYQMLKKQGILQHDPQIPVDKTLVPSPPTRPKNAVFEDDEKSKLLARLLKSKNPDDLQEANKLIKNMVKEDEVRMQKITKRLNTLEEVNNNVRLLNEMLVHYNQEESTDGDKELIKELYDRCEKMRRTLFKLASETEDNDNCLGEILQASDELSRVINSYKKIVQGQTVNGESGHSSLLTVSVYFKRRESRHRGSSSGLSGMSGSGFCTPSGAPGSPLLRSLSPQPSSPLRTGLLAEASLGNVLVQLETIKPSNVLPVTAYDKNGFRVLLHFAKDCPPSRPDVLVIVISMISTAPVPISNVVLQAAVPKAMKVKLQPPSGSELAPFNPVLPPAAITQVMLLANPLKEKVRLRYKLTFTMGDQPYSDLGEVDQFPPAERWGSL